MGPAPLDDDNVGDEWFPATRGDLSRLEGRMRRPRDYRGTPTALAAGMTTRELRDVAITWMVVRLGATHAQVAPAFGLKRRAVTAIVNRTHLAIGQHLRDD